MATLSGSTRPPKTYADWDTSVWELGIRWAAIIAHSLPNKKTNEGPSGTTMNGRPQATFRRSTSRPVAPGCRGRANGQFAHIPGCPPNAKRNGNRLQIRSIPAAKTLKLTTGVGGSIDQGKPERRDLLNGNTPEFFPVLSERAARLLEGIMFAKGRFASLILRQTQASETRKSFFHRLAKRLLYQRNTATPQDCGTKTFPPTVERGGPLPHLLWIMNMGPSTTNHVHFQWQVCGSSKAGP